MEILHGGMAAAMIVRMQSKEQYQQAYFNEMSFLALMLDGRTVVQLCRNNPTTPR